MTLFVIFYPYYFVCTILSVPFCPIPFCPCTILSIPFCPYHFVRYHFVLEPGNCPSWEGNCPGVNCPFPMYVSLHVLHTYMQCTYIIPTCTYLHTYIHLYVCLQVFICPHACI